MPEPFTVTSDEGKACFSSLVQCLMLFGVSYLLMSVIKRCVRRITSIGTALTLVLAGGLAGCSGPEPRAATAPLAETTSAEAFARGVVKLVGARRVDRIAALVHPERGLLFSPYAYIDRDQSIMLCPAALREAWQQNAVLRFGFADGTGEPIDLPIRAYFDLWLYGADYAEAPSVAVNRELGRGNSINNLGDVFPDADFVEFHFPGFNPAYQGLDWLSLRVVISRRPDGGWWLLGLVNDRWTI